MNTYHAIVSRDGKYWLVHVLELNQYTQARSLAEVEPMARDLIALVVGIAADSFEFEFETKLSDSVRHHLELADKYASDSAWAQSEAATERRFAAREMRAEGMTVRDIGAALGVSHQRAQQLISSKSSAGERAAAPVDIEQTASPISGQSPLPPEVVIFRCSEGRVPAWQFHSMRQDAVGGGDNLDEAKARYRDALASALNLDDPGEMPPITEYIERETSRGSGVWVRTDASAPRGADWVRAIAQNYESMPAGYRTWVRESQAASGDTVVIPVEPSDTLRKVLEQITAYDAILLVALTTDPSTKRQHLMWQPVDGISAKKPASGEEPIGMSDAGLTPESPIGNVFKIGMTKPGPEPHSRRRIALAPTC
jgi:predicted RNase H-like HicB family nuclease